LIRAAMLLKSGDADRVLVVASESSLHEAFIQSFRRLGVIAASGEPCRPFDQRRSGFLVSEAAAAVCLERRRPRLGEVVIDDYALGADASHLTGTDPQALALKSCLRRANNARPVDLVHAHATGTVANDPIELSAIETVTDGSPIIYSHKGAIGHTLGASGLVATVLNVLAHRYGEVPPNVCTTNPIPTQAGQISRQGVQRPIRRSLAIAAGFGGATGVVAFQTHD
jgi:3-oxoacyl-(acyl-carrier-protein) synthase